MDQSHKKSEPTPRPAIPILASHILELEEKQRNRFASSESDQRIKSGCAEVDDLLGGGFERGIVVGISADGIMGRLISLHLLASVLVHRLTSPTATSPSKAIVIDTTGSFPLSLLAEILKSRITAAQNLSILDARKAASHQRKGKKTRNAVDDDVQKCLEMVALSRVFDIEGLWEVLGEVGRQSGSEDTDDVNMGNDIEGSTEKDLPLEVYDSQDEDALSDDENITSHTTRSKNSHSTSSDPGTEIIIIDNMTHIINELFARKENNEAHELLSLLTLTLRTLSSTQNILTVLHNTTVSSKTYTTNTAGPSKSETNTNQYIPPSLQKQKPNPAPSLPTSIFASNPLKPALGQIFPPFPSLHLLLSAMMPKLRADADVLYGQGTQRPNNEGGEEEGEREVEYCTILEVLKDETPILGSDREKARKFGWREQAWTTLEVDAAGTGLVDTFQAKGGMRGMGMEREKAGGLTDVGRMAKVHGLGGRRV